MFESVDIKLSQFQRLRQIEEKYKINFKKYQLNAEFYNQNPSEFDTLPNTDAWSENSQKLPDMVYFNRDKIVRMMLSRFTIAEQGDILQNFPDLLTLRLEFCGLTKISPLITCLRSLRVLSLKGNYLYDLPAELRGLANLKSLNLSENLFEALDFSKLPVNLDKLSLIDNKISSVYHTTKEFPLLTWVGLKGNRISLPAPRWMLKISYKP